MMKCPNCSEEMFIETGVHWLVKEEEQIDEDDFLLRCAYCWNLYTRRYLNEKNKK